MRGTIFFQKVCTPMSLSDTAIRNAKPSSNPYKLPDERGLFLLVHPNGSKYWRQKYRYEGKEKTLAHGVYPEISLKDARERRESARKLLAQGVDPSENKKAQRAARQERATNSFEVVAREWFETKRKTWASSHADKVIRRLENNIFPWLGGRAIAEITAPELLACIRRIEKRGVLETAHRALENCGQVFRYAIVTGRAERSPAGDLKGALPAITRKHFPSIIDPVEIGGLLRSLDAFKGTFIVKSALLLAPLLFVRPGELRQAEWEGFDLKKAEWRYLVTKTKTEQLVPLASQAVEILKELHPLTGHGRYVFPGRNPQQAMSDAAVNAALRRMGYDTKTEITGHGFRAMARTILAEELHQRPEVIEHQLAHKVPDILGTAYNRTKFLKERKIMMQLWADYLDELKIGVDSTS